MSRSLGALIVVPDIVSVWFPVILQFLGHALWRHYLLQHEGGDLLGLDAHGPDAGSRGGGILGGSGGYVPDCKTPTTTGGETVNTAGVTTSGFYFLFVIFYPCSLSIETIIELNHIKWKSKSSAIFVLDWKKKNFRCCFNNHWRIIIWLYYL